MSNDTPRWAGRSSGRSLLPLWIPLAVFGIFFAAGLPIAGSMARPAEAALVVPPATAPTLSPLAPAATPPKTPIVFIPGISGSQLAYSSTAGLTNYWLGFGQDHSALSLRPGDPKSLPMIATDVIRYAIPSIKYGPQYAPLLEMLADPARGGYVEYQVNNDPSRRTAAGCDTSQAGAQPTLFVFAYDWRRSNEESAQLLRQYIQCIQQIYPGTKVNLLAHSMGSLVGRRYILDFPTDHSVDQLLTVGGPWLGAPKVINVLETGDFGLPSFLITQAQLKALIEYYPGGHQLLPAAQYYDLGGQPFATQSPTLTTFTSYSDTSTILNTRFYTTTPATTERIFNSLPGQVDWRSDTSGVRYSHVAGLQAGANTVGTVIGVTDTICNSALQCTSFANFKTALTFGDGTVPITSATRISDSLDLNAPTAAVHVFSAITASQNVSVEHTGLTQNPDVWSLITRTLSSGPVTATRAAPIPVPAPLFAVRATNVASLTVQNDLGQSAPLPAPVPGAAFGNDVAGIVYQPVSERSKMVTLVPDRAYTVTLGTGPEPFALDVTSANGISTTTAIRYHDVTLPPSTTVVLRIAPNGVGPLQADTDRDGIPETIVPMTFSLTGSRANDWSPPAITTTVAYTGATGLATIAATDDLPGAIKLFYSLDGRQYRPYTATVPVDARLAGSLHVFAEDAQGNRRAVRQAILPAQAAFLPFLARHQSSSGW